MKSAIIKTLLYADIFDYPLKPEEVWQWLIWEKKELPSKLNFEKALSDFKKIKGLYSLNDKRELVILRKQREKYSAKKFIKARKISRIAGIIPLVKFVGITGALAMENAKEDDDIDFLIITASGWLWTTRFLITILLNLLGVRRKPQDKVFKDKICLNLFLEEDHLGFKKQNLFLAHEISQVRPLVDKNKTYQRFLAANKWVKNYLPNAFN